MNKNKKNDMRPFDMKKEPKTVPKYLLPLVWGGAFFATAPQKLKIKKTGMEGIKPPFLVLSMHQGFSDYFIAPRALFPYKANYVSDMEGFANYGEWLYRSIGCIGKRRYTPDVTVIQNIGKCFNAGNPVVIFPESRHSNVGTTAKLPKNLGRLAIHFAKRYNTPLVILSIHGSYLANPFWDEEHTRKGRMEAELKLLYTAEELLSRNEDIIQKRIEDALTYDEYEWQQQNNLVFAGKNLAEGLSKPLYQCRSCGTKYKMVSKDDRIGCTACRKVWKFIPKGYLRDTRGRKYSITEWYDWERENVLKELSEYEYPNKKGDGAVSGQVGFRKEFRVQIEALPNEKGFVNLGEGKLTLTDKEFILKFRQERRYNYIPKDWKIEKKDGVKTVSISFPHKYRESLQTEYNYRGKGMAIVLSNTDATYYLYSDDKDFNVTELQFIAENLSEGQSPW